MGRAAVPLDTIWPNGSDPKTLVCVRAQCSVGELFNTVFGEPDLSEQLHKQRGDTELVDTPWYPAREDLPPELYTWQVSDPPNKPSDMLRHRKVRFESPPTALASRPFQNEESQVVTELYPDTLYVVEAVSSTSAPYGDKFNVFFRYIFRADPPPSPDNNNNNASSPSSFSPSFPSSALHVLFHVEWLPAMNRMMRPVVGKAVDAGVRSTFKIFRTVLGSLRPVVDIKESELPAGGPPAVVVAAEHPTGVRLGAEAEEAAGAVMAPAAVAAGGPYVAAAAAAGFAPVTGRPPDLLSVMTQQLVYKDQVVLLADLLGAGLRSVSASDPTAQLLAAALTVWLISLVVAGLRGWQALCGASGGGGGLTWLLRLCVCWPLALVDLPDSTAEVLTSMAMVAGINWAVIRGSEAVVRYLSKANPALLAAARGGSLSGGDHGGSPGGAGAGSGGGGGDVIGGVPFSQTPVLGSRASGGGAAAMSRASGGGAGGANGGLMNRVPSAAAAMSRVGSTGAARPPSSAAAAPPAAAAATGKEKEKDKRRSGSGGVGSVAAFWSAATAAATPKPKPMRAAPAPKQFTAEQLRQLELGQVSKKPPADAAPAEATPPPPPPPGEAEAVPAAAAAMTDAWAADLPVVPASISAEPPRPPSPPPRRRTPSPPPKAAPPPPPPAARSGNAAAAEPASTKPSEGGPGAAAAVQPPAPAPPSLAGKSAPAPAPAPPVALSGALTTSQAAPPAAVAVGSLPASTTFANMFTREGIDSMAESLRSAFRWDTAKTADFATETGSLEPATSPRASSHSQPHQQQLAKLKAKSDAGEAAAAAAARRGGSAAAPPGPRSAGGTQSATAAAAAPAATSLSVLAAHSDMPLLPPHEEEGIYGTYGGAGDGDDEYDDELMEPAVVVEEVFENERFQPFRGWGHMWPGHFLPSDRVGHWSDRQGKPGGGASMVFEQVVPQLPGGWQWVEEDWQVDLEGLDVDAVDPDGWTYALDFYLLKYPPPPQGGKCSLKHFVRRRRFFRTRVRDESRSSRPSTGGGSYGGKPSGSAAASEDGGGGRYDGRPAAGRAPPVDAAAVVAGDAGDDPLKVGERLLSLSEGISAASSPASEPPPPQPRGAGDGGGGDSADVELRPAPLTASTPVKAEGLADAQARKQQQPQQETEGGAPRRNDRASSSGATGEPAAAAAAPAQATLELLSSSGPAGGGNTGGGGGGTPPSAQYVMSPKTEVTSHDPLGALGAAGELRLPSACGDGTDPRLPPLPVAAAEPASRPTAAAAMEVPKSETAAAGAGATATGSRDGRPSADAAASSGKPSPPPPDFLAAPPPPPLARKPSVAAALSAPGVVAASEEAAAAATMGAAGTADGSPAAAKAEAEADLAPAVRQESGEGGPWKGLAKAKQPGAERGKGAEAPSPPPARSGTGVGAPDATAVDCAMAEGPIIAAELVE